MTTSPATPPPLKAGNTFPDGITFTYIPHSPDTADFQSCGLAQKYKFSEEAKSKKIVLVAIPGAFTPTCSADHLPSYLAKRAELAAKGVDQIVFLAHNDAWVMSGWGKANQVTDDSIIFASDEDLAFSKLIGWFNGERAGRYAIVVDHGKVTYADIDTAKGSIEKTGAEAVLAQL